MKFEKGTAKPANSGRKKGVTNKKTAELKDMIRNALDQAGGEKYLLKQANENPQAFMGLLAKILPKDVNVGGQPGNPVQVTKIELVGFNDDNADSAS